MERRVVKRGGMMKIRNSTQGDGGFEVRNKLVRPILDEPEDFSAKQQQSHDLSVAMIPVMTESYNSTHSPFFLHSGDHYQ